MLLSQLSYLCKELLPDLHLVAMAQALDRLRQDVLG